MGQDYHQTVVCPMGAQLSDDKRINGGEAAVNSLIILLNYLSGWTKLTYFFEPNRGPDFSQKTARLDAVTKGRNRFEEPIPALCTFGGSTFGRSNQ